MSKNYHLIILAILSTLIFFVIKDASAQPQTSVLSGTIVRNSHRCQMDGICFLEVQKIDGAVVQIYYGWESLGDGIVCRADQTLSNIAWSLKPGQVIEAKGQVAQDRRIIYLCSEQNHYLNVTSGK